MPSADVSAPELQSLFLAFMEYRKNPPAFEPKPVPQLLVRERLPQYLHSVAGMRPSLQAIFYEVLRGKENSKLLSEALARLLTLWSDIDMTRIDPWVVLDDEAEEGQEEQLSVTASWIRYAHVLRVPF